MVLVPESMVDLVPAGAPALEPVGENVVIHRMRPSSDRHFSDSPISRETPSGPSESSSPRSRAGVQCSRPACDEGDECEDDGS